MLTEHEKDELKRIYWTNALFFGFTNCPFPPKLGVVYAFDMSDDTVKIGVTKNTEKRAKSVKNAVYLDVLRVHKTGVAPLDFMRVIESRCHAAFDDRRVRGEFFNITFEEAVAELDKHATEISAALADADQRYLDEVDFYYNEFLPEYEEYKAKNSSPVEKKKEHESGWNVVDEHHTKKMPLKRARYEERRLHKKYSHVNVHGEYFNADFDDVKGDIDEITLTLEEEIVIGVSDNDKKLLVEIKTFSGNVPYQFAPPRKINQGDGESFIWRKNFLVNDNVRGVLIFNLVAVHETKS